jgi:hypothetical protein
MIADAGSFRDPEAAGEYASFPVEDLIRHHRRST